MVYIIETERLLIKPLDFTELQLYIENDNSLETRLCVEDSNRVFSPELKDALEQSILPQVAENEKSYLFFTLWTIILKSEKRLAGDLCFKGLPDAAGNIEIGYGTYEEFTGRGLMTEAVRGMMEWAAKQPVVKSVTAATEKTNVASMIILQKNGFRKIDESDEYFHWKLQL